jgi:hypothetical protein
MAEGPTSAVASARKPRWTEPLAITVGVHSLWALYRAWGLSGKGAVGGLSGEDVTREGGNRGDGSVWRGGDRLRRPAAGR